MGNPPPTGCAALDRTTAAHLLPGTLGPFAARSAVTFDARPAPRARRTYGATDGHFVIELVDLGQAPAALHAVRAGQQQDVRTPDRSVIGTHVGDTWVMTQWTAGDRTARVAALLAERFVMGIAVTPAASIEPALAAAAHVDFAGVDRALRACR